MSCEGRRPSGCGTCGGAGQISVPACPLTEVDDATLEALDLADLMKKGVLPVAGGLLDQTESILQAVAMVHREQAAWRREKGWSADPDDA